ncbi:acyl-coenzyme A:6-aminopenicillanic acid acyl-transferase-domain-containing protein [Hyaloraphidium curvatum]|nr:acyl-coenzyme A:6-aminopenicillanic acid acyl-transferase-domain-containing protein [Hyaloraphidium curvatum]
MADGKLRIIDVAGTASERGFAQGQLLGDIIRTQIGLFLDGICRTHSLDSADAYLKVFVEETGYVATITEHALHLLEEVRGIADGAGLPFEHVLAYNLLDEEWEFSKQWKKRTSNGVPNGEPPGCTVAGFTSRDGGVYLSQTMDIPDFHDGSQVVVRHHLSDAGDGPSALLVFTAAGLIALFGCNSSGLAVAVNNLSTLPTSDSGLPVAFVIRSLLERTDISSAETFLKSVGHAIGQHYALASPEGLRSVEAGAGGSVYRDEGVSDILLHTNHPLTPGAKSCSIADDDPGFSRARLGVISSAAPNLKSEKDLMAALADRSAPVSRSRDPTVAGPQFLTFGSFVSCSRTGAAPRFWVAPGPPHLVDFKEVPWGPVPLENGNHLG